MNKRKFAPLAFFTALAIAIVGLTFSIRSATAQDRRLMPPLTSRQLEKLARSTSTPPPSEDRVGLYQALLDMQNPWPVMCVAAHPDRKSTRLNSSHIPLSRIPSSALK